MSLSLLDELEVQYPVIKKELNPNIWWRQNYGFARFERESAWRRHCSCSRSDTARRNFYRPGAYWLNTRSNNGEGKDCFTFEGLSSVCLVFYHRFDAALLLLKFSWQLARYVSLAKMLVHSYRRSLDEDGRSLWVGTSGSSFPAIDRFHLRGKMAAACPRWYNAALTHTKWMGNPSSPTLSSNCENRRACFCQTSPGMHVWGVLVPIRTVFNRSYCPRG